MSKVELAYQPINVLAENMRNLNANVPTLNVRQFIMSLLFAFGVLLTAIALKDTFETWQELIAFQLMNV